ncbi:hypothetical protein AP1_0427 [Aeromonas phage AP1]|nr:hypothetical protein AP1_0427 [Aeromonas phage AP1]
MVVLLQYRTADDLHTNVRKFENRFRSSDLLVVTQEGGVFFLGLTIDVHDVSGLSDPVTPESDTRTEHTDVSHQDATHVTDFHVTGTLLAAFIDVTIIELFEHERVEQNFGDGVHDEQHRTLDANPFTGLGRNERSVDEHSFVSSVTTGGEIKIDSAAPAVDGPVQIRPAAIDLHVGFIHVPRAKIGRVTPVPAQPFFHFRRITLNPAVNRGVIDIHSAFSQHLLQFHNIVKCKLKHHCQGYSSVRQFPA